MLDGPACILDLAGAYRILQKAWKLYVGRSGVHSGSCPIIIAHTHRDRCASHMMHVSLPQNPQHSRTWILHPATRRAASITMDVYLQWIGGSFYRCVTPRMRPT